MIYFNGTLITAQEEKEYKKALDSQLSTGSNEKINRINRILQEKYR